MKTFNHADYQRRLANLIRIGTVELTLYFMMYTNLMTYPLKFRQHVLAIKEKEKLTYAKTASRFGVGMASPMRWNRRITLCTTHNKPATKIDMEALAEDVATYPDDYQYERAKRFGVSFGILGRPAPYELPVSSHS
ncbi:IS630 transposase-related protein [Candidatus Regiella endosymbiont of Tuberolachnus salignus]|uniref:IS630 transposase-related protein n=1 Tax=Candidatus Regiella endosymbiont of Tuberolachnus salignus TaxID=3077956 RepID=UPI0030CE91D1